MKKVSLMLLSILLVASIFSGCTLEVESGPKVRIGIIQFADHPALNNCRKGFADEVVNAGVNADFDYQNCYISLQQADAIAKSMVDENYDLIVAIGTPAAQAAYSNAKGTNIPVLFMAVSDPELAGLTEPGVNITGVSSPPDVNAQIELIKEYLPYTISIGTVYNPEEINSVKQVEQLRAAAEAAGYYFESGTATWSGRVPTATKNVLEKVDVIVAVLDNTTAMEMEQIVYLATAAGKPVIGAEEEHVKKGAIISEGHDYTNIGMRAGKMALRILMGRKAADIPIETVTDMRVITNPLVMTELGLMD